MPNYKHPIIIQAYSKESVFDDVGNDITDFVDLLKCRAQINGIGGKEYYAAAQNNAENDVTFEVRYCKALKDITPQSARIVYAGHFYDIKHIDDFMQTRESLKIKAVRKIG